MNKRNIIIILLVLLLIAGIIVIIKRVSGPPHATKPMVMISRTNIKAGDSISYADNTQGAKSWFWDFDNGQTSIDKAGVTVFTTAGDYRIRVTVNGPFGTFKDSNLVVHVAPAFNPEPEEPKLLPPSGPGVTFVNRKVTFTDNTPNATSWAWQFGESGNVDDTGKTASHIYKNPGKYAIVVTNSTSTKEQGRWKIEVKPEPSEYHPTNSSNNNKARPVMKTEVNPAAGIQALAQEFLNKCRDPNNKDPRFPSQYTQLRNAYFSGGESVDVKLNEANYGDVYKYFNHLRIQRPDVTIKVTQVDRDSSGHIIGISITEVKR